MAKTYYYAIVNKNNNLVTLEGNLPIYWNKTVAIRERIERCSDSEKIIRIKITDLVRLIKPYKLTENSFTGDISGLPTNLKLIVGSKLVGKI
jgi:hypothetical protein